jgi:hypothetical protein
MPRPAVVLLAAAFAAPAAALAQTPSPATQEVPQPPPSDDGTDDSVFDAPVDFSMPPAAIAPSKLDPSKFAAPAPGSGWSANAGVGSAPGTPPAAAPPPPDVLLPNAPPTAQSGAAWASISAPSLDTPLSWDKASIETRVDPLQDQSKLGMSFSRSVPVGSDLSVTLQNGYSMTQPMPGSVPVVPPALAATPSTSAARALDTNGAVKLNILPSDTSVSLGAALSSTDPKWLRSLSAEQKLFNGPFNITGSLSETTTGEYNKTVKGGFKQSW